MKSQNTKNAHTAAERPLRPLNTLYFYLTEGCNLACRHCWMGPRYDATGKNYPTLPVEVFETAIREAKPLGLSGVKLTGGEPLLHPQIAHLIEIVQRESLRLTVETNGLLCTPEIAAAIAKTPKAFVSVSIDGVDAATHEWVRGVPGSFDAACRAVQNLVAVGIRPQIIFSLMRCNAEQAEAMVRMAEELGASSLKFNIVQPTARGKQLHESLETLTIDELIAIGRHVEQELAPSAKIRLIFHYPPAFRSLRYIATGDGCSTCGIFGILGVMASGQYSLCGIGEQVPELIFGKVGVDALETVWRDNPVLHELRDGLPDRLEGVCGRCLMKRTCLGSCVAQNFYSKGSLWAPYWFCEQAEAAGLFPASRLLSNPAMDTEPQPAVVDQRQMAAEMV